MSQSNYEKVRDYLLTLECAIVKESPQEQWFIIDKEEEGITNMVIQVAEPILVVEQHLFVLKSDKPAVYKELLKKNGDIIHGAFVLGEDEKNVFFRDTLAIENLDINELQSTLNSLGLLLAEFTDEIIEYSK